VVVVVGSLPPLVVMVVVVGSLPPRRRPGGRGGGLAAPGAAVLVVVVPALPPLWWLVVELKARRSAWSRLAEFQTPTIFDRGRYFNCSTFYRLPKIVKLITCTRYMNRNVSPFFRC
jgi:hypothetical protein